MQFYTGAKKVAKMVILGAFFRAQKTLFFAILGVFRGQKFFRRQIRVFQLFLPLEMIFLEKNFFEKIPPKMTIFATFFAPPCSCFM